MIRSFILILLSSLFVISCVATGNITEYSSEKISGEKIIAANIHNLYSYNDTRKFLENYQRALTSRDAQAYVDGEPEVVDQTELINQFGLLRNQFLGVLKALEAKQFQINNIVKLRVAGLEDSEINIFYGNPNK